MSTILDWMTDLNHLLQKTAHNRLSDQDLLDRLNQYCVDSLGAAFARIWMMDTYTNTLILRSSRGQYTRLNGTRAKIAIGQGSKIDKIYVECNPHVTNDTLNDPGVKDKEWAKREGFIAFAGYPLCWHDSKLGVLGMYSRQPLSDDLLLVLGVFTALASAVIFQQQQTEHNMTKFCEVTGFKPTLLAQLIKLGRDGN